MQVTDQQDEQLAMKRAAELGVSVSLARATKIRHWLVNRAYSAAMEFAAMPDEIAANTLGISIEDARRKKRWIRDCYDSACDIETQFPAEPLPKKFGQLLIAGRMLIRRRQAHHFAECFYIASCGSLRELQGGLASLSVQCAQLLADWLGCGAAKRSGARRRAG
ncbi:MAG: hypothetical protein DWQ37_20195 [Planctomycetota bacterium]|nr:MAG: hypothetical protein DWQ37_20195 [Planctomycetota bacterium]